MSMIREMFGGWSLEEEDAMEIKIDSTMLVNFGDNDGHTFLLMFSFARFFSCKRI